MRHEHIGLCGMNKKKYFIFLFFTFILFLNGCVPPPTYSEYSSVGDVNGISSNKVTLDETTALNNQNVPLICNNLPANMLSTCLESVDKEKQKLRNVSPAILANNCYAKGVSGSLVDDAQAYFKLQVLNNDLNGILSTYDNFAMCHWSSNDFASAKKYIDNFDLLLDIVPIIKNNNGLMGGMGRWIPADSDGHRWHIGHQAVRFIENTLRTRHKSLCEGNSCKDFAWKITQDGLSNDFQKSLAHKYVKNSEFKSLYEKRQFLTAQKSLMILADKESVLPINIEWIKYIENQINEISNQLHKFSPQIMAIEKYNKFSIDQVQEYIKPDETIVSYLHSIECRNPLVWNVSKNNSSLKMIGEKGQGCTTKDIKDAIYSVKNKIVSNDVTLSQIDSDLTWLSNQLILPLSLPKPGSKIIFVLDEVMAGLPFELLKTSNGDLLGEVYDIAYTPSVPLHLYLATMQEKSYNSLYAGFSKDDHMSSLAKLGSNRFISLLANEYRGMAYPEAKEEDIYNKELNAKVLHFITHSGIENGEHGLYYGRSAMEDGFVTGDEISNKSSIAANTILITSCDSAGTNTSPQVGEAYSGLSRNLLISGAKKVVISRWEVPESIAHEFSKKYLQYTEKEGLSSVIAIRKIRNEICNSDNPKCWAAWMLLGS